MEIEPFEPTFLNGSDIETLLSNLKLTPTAGAFAQEYYTLTPEQANS